MEARHPGTSVDTLLTYPTNEVCLQQGGLEGGGGYQTGWTFCLMSGTLFSWHSVLYKLHRPTSKSRDAKINGLQGSWSRSR